MVWRARVLVMSETSLVLWDKDAGFIVAIDCLAFDHNKAVIWSTALGGRIPSVINAVGIGYCCVFDCDKSIGTSHVIWH